MQPSRSKGKRRLRWHRRGDSVACDHSAPAATEGAAASGWSESEGNLYVLTVLEQGTDVMGHVYVMATYCAYGDGQVRTRRLRLWWGLLATQPLDAHTSM